MSLHFELATVVETAFPKQLEAPLEQKQDALIIRLKNGVVLTVHYAADDAYSLHWNHDASGLEARIDTAPLHRDLATFPNHFHNPGGHVSADPITRPDATPADNLQRLIGALLDDPTLGAADIG